MPLWQVQCSARAENEWSQGEVRWDFDSDHKANDFLGGHMPGPHLELSRAWLHAVTTPPTPQPSLALFLSDPMFANPDPREPYLGQCVPGFSYGQSWATVV